MDLKYVLSILLKILISTPSTLVFVDQVHKATGAALLGDHFVNRSNISSNATEEDVYYDYDMSDSQELDTKVCIFFIQKLIQYLSFSSSNLIFFHCRIPKQIQKKSRIHLH